MPPSMPDSMWPSRCSWHVAHERRHRRDAVDLVERHRVERAWPSGRKPSNTSVDTRRCGRVDLAVLAVEADLHVALLDDVAPRAADAQVDLADHPHEVSKPHQRLTSSGVVSALKTSSAGASNGPGDEDLGVRRQGDDGGAVAVVTGWCSWWFLLVLELGEQVVEPVETGVPGALERAHPVVDRLQRRTVDPVPAVPPVHADEHEADRPQHARGAWTPAAG